MLLSVTTLFAKMDKGKHTRIPASEAEHSEGMLSGLHLMSSKCCANLLPAPYGARRWYHNPWTVCTDEICPEVERNDPEVEVRGDESTKSSRRDGPNKH
jgi:hypothetical protein